jgi:hypothetical protein
MFISHKSYIDSSGNLKPDDKPHENLEIWNAQNGELVQKWVQKKQFDWFVSFSANCV